MPARQIKRWAIVASTALIAATPVITAASGPEPDPQVYMQAFNDTCRRGFPDLDAIAANVIAHGWQESSMRLISGPPEALTASLPRVFHKDGLMLFLTRPTSGDFQQICEISGSAQTKLTGADIAAVISSGLTAGAPTPDKAKDRDKAIWTVAPGITVDAGIAIYRKSRTISIAVRHARTM